VQYKIITCTLCDYKCVLISDKHMRSSHGWDAPLYYNVFQPCALMSQGLREICMHLTNNIDMCT